MLSNKCEGANPESREGDVTIMDDNDNKMGKHNDRGELPNSIHKPGRELGIVS